MAELIDPDLPVRIARAKRQRDALQLRLDAIAPWKWVRESDGRRRGLYSPEQRDLQKDIAWRIGSLALVIDALSAAAAQTEDWT